MDAAAMKAEPVQERRGRGQVALDLLDRTFRYWSVLPAIILLLVLTVVPVANLLRMAVSDISFVRGQAVWEFVGLSHFEDLAKDWLLLVVLRNTLVFVVATVVLEMVLGFFLAMLVSRLRRAVGVYRTIMVIPILVPAVAIGSMWRLLYNTDFGPINSAIVSLGGMPIPFTSSTCYAMLSVVLVDIWHWVPFVFLICLAGFEALPTEVLEAASVDGASGRTMLRRIIIPLMGPTLIVALMFRTIYAFKAFDEIFLLTSGGPGTSTEVISLYIYKVFFQQYRLGYGALVSILTILLSGAFLVSFLRLRRRES